MRSVKTSLKARELTDRSSFLVEYAILSAYREDFFSSICCIVVIWVPLLMEGSLLSVRVSLSIRTVFSGCSNQTFM